MGTWTLLAIGAQVKLLPDAWRSRFWRLAALMLTGSLVATWPPVESAVFYVLWSMAIAAGIISQKYPKAPPGTTWLPVGIQSLLAGMAVGALAMVLELHGSAAWPWAVWIVIIYGGAFRMAYDELLSSISGKARTNSEEPRATAG